MPLIKIYMNKIIALAGIVAAAFLYGRHERSKGKKIERERQEDIDHETASEIRDRVRDVDDISLQPDELKYRD